MHAFTTKVIQQGSPASRLSNAHTDRLAPDRPASSSSPGARRGSRGTRTAPVGGTRSSSPAGCETSGAGRSCRRRNAGASCARRSCAAISGVPCSPTANPSATSIDACARLRRSVSSKSQCQQNGLEFRPARRIVGTAFVLFCCRTILGNGAWKGRRLLPATGAFPFLWAGGSLGSSFIPSRTLSGNTVSLGRENGRGFIVFGPVTIRS